jgi:DNA-binding NarL/FixJ family response regulator
MMEILIITDDDILFNTLNDALVKGSVSVTRASGKDELVSFNPSGAVVLDIQSVTGNSIPAFSCPVAALTSVPKYEEAMRLMRKGVKGYGNRYMPADNIRQLVETVLRGQIWLPPALISRVISSIQHVSSPDNHSLFLDELSEREKEVADYVGKGMSNKEISEQMEITTRTVKAHLSSIFMKTGCRDRLELALKIKNED